MHQLETLYSYFLSEQIQLWGEIKDCCAPLWLLSKQTPVFPHYITYGECRLPSKIRFALCVI